MKKTLLATLILALAFAAAQAAPAKKAGKVLKVGTLVPEGSAWYLILKEMGEQWKAQGVELRLYPGGVLGDERDVIRKMRIGQVQGGVMTVAGLSEIDKSVMALAMPMMYASDEELDYVRDRMRKHLEARFAASGFVILNWGDAGWVTFFGKRPILVPEDLKSMKFFVWAGDNDSLKLWKSAGYNPIPLAPTDIMTGLQTGLIDSFDTTPISALSFQWFASAPNMTDLKWAPLLGATVVTKKAWDTIPAAARPAILKSAEEAGRRLREDIRSKETEVMDTMRKHGLKVVSITPEQHAQWQKTFEESYPKIIGSLVPPASFQEAKKYRDEYRARKK